MNNNKHDRHFDIGKLLAKITYKEHEYMTWFECDYGSYKTSFQLQSFSKASWPCKKLINKSDFNEALEHNLEGKTSEKDRVWPEKSTLLVVFADLRKNSKLDGEFLIAWTYFSNGEPSLKSAKQPTKYYTLAIEAAY